MPWKNGKSSGDDMHIRPAPVSISLAIVLALIFFLNAPCLGGEAEDPPVVEVRGYLSHAAVRPGDSFRIALHASIKSGFHINSHTPADEFLVPTDVLFNETKGITFGPVAYPIPALVSLAFSKNKVSVYEGTVAILTTAHVSKDAVSGKRTVSGEFSYQACNDKSCFMPETVRFEQSLEVAGPHEQERLINEGIFQGPDLTAHEKTAKRTVEGGLFYALWTFFVFGLGLNLTPCVYPVIPMTVGFFAQQGEHRKGRSFFLATIYVFGIAVIFSVLGLVSGLAGKQWGFLFQSPWFVIAVAMAILAMSASMFGAFEITIPSFLMQLGGRSRRGVFGALVMGLTVGVVIAPCAAGIVLGLVGIIAKLGMVWKGALFFFVLGVGLGFPYLFLAVFSHGLTRLPQSGMWMVWVRKLFGILLLGVALYFLIPQGKQAADQQFFYLGVLGIFGGLFLGFLDSSEGFSRTFKLTRTLIGVFLIIVGGTMVQRSLTVPQESISWVHSVEEFRSEGKPLLIDFYADWCAACKELDRHTFSDEKVMDLSKQFVMAKVDLTSPSAANTVFRQKFKVSGLPTVVFVDADGEERKDLRIVGFVGPEEMLNNMKALLME